MATNQESLEERLERIKLKNKELEKKHRIAEEDRLDAMKVGALVSMKPATIDDWPIEHKYDNEDYKDDKEEAEKDEDDDPTKPSQRKPIISRTGKEICPPADPAYNFLADETRDGKKKMNLQPIVKTQEPHIKKQPQNNQQHKNHNRNAHHEKNKSSNLQRSKSHNEGNWRQPANNNHNNNSNNKDKRQFHHEDQSQPPHFNRQKSLNEKHYNNNNKNMQERSPNSTTFQQPSFHHQHQQQQMPRNQEFADRGNISVSVSRDGEVKSVRLTSAPVIGSGRVAHSRQHNTKPQFVVNMNDQEFIQNHQEFQPLHSEKNSDRKFNSRKKFNPNANQGNSSIQSAVVIPPDNNIKKISVQDRLQRTRYNDDEFSGAVNQTAQ